MTAQCLKSGPVRTLAIESSMRNQPDGDRGDACHRRNNPGRRRIRSSRQEYEMILFVENTQMHAKMIEQARISATDVGIR